MSAIVAGERLSPIGDTTVLTRRKGFGLVIMQDGLVLVEMRAQPHDATVTDSPAYAQLPQSSSAMTPIKAARHYITDHTPLDGFTLRALEFGCELTLDTLSDAWQQNKGWRDTVRDWMLFGQGDMRLPETFAPGGRTFAWVTPDMLLDQCQTFRQDNYRKVLDYFKDYLEHYSHH